MKLIASLIITLSLVGGLVAATTAYAPSLSADDDALIGLTLSAPAGVVRLADGAAIGSLGAGSSLAGLDDAARGALPQDADEAALTLAALAGRDAASLRVDESTGVVFTAGLQAIPLVSGGEINGETLRAIRANAAALTGTHYETKTLRVREFSLARWSYAWLLGLSVIGLGVGAALIRMAGKQALAAVAEGAAEEGPAQALKVLAEELSRLEVDLERMDSDAERLQSIIKRIDSMQAAHVAPFLDGRAELIGQHGMAGYARLMDKFAGAERVMNRAWSAAADGVLDEAMLCVRESASRMREAAA